MKYKLINFDIGMKAHSFLACKGKLCFAKAKPLQSIPFCAMLNNVKLDNFLRR